MRFLLMLFALTFGLAACGGSYEPPKAEAPAVAPSTVKADEAQERKIHEQKRAKAEKEDRQRDITLAKNAITAFYGSQGGNVQEAVRRGPVFGGLCNRAEALFELNARTFVRLEEAPNAPHIGWQEIGVERAQLWRDFLVESQRTADGLYALLGRPHAERHATCGMGEGFWSFQNPGEVAMRLVWVMDGAKLTSPTPTAIRTALIADYQVYFVWYRQMIARGEASRSDSAGIIVAAVRDATANWNIGVAELRLTAEEKKLFAAR